MDSKIKLVTLTDVALRAGMPIPTVHKLTARGVLPAADIRAGREGYYSPALVDTIVRFFETEYVRYKRYPAGYVKHDETGAEESRAAHERALVDTVLDQIPALRGVVPDEVILRFARANKIKPAPDVQHKEEHGE